MTQTTLTLNATALQPTLRTLSLLSHFTLTSLSLHLTIQFDSFSLTRRFCRKAAQRGFSKIAFLKFADEVGCGSIFVTKVNPLSEAGIRLLMRGTAICLSEFAIHLSCINDLCHKRGSFNTKSLAQIEESPRITRFPVVILSVVLLL